MMDDADDWEEDQLVLVELVGLLEQEVLFKATTPLCRLLGVDTEEPLLQIGPYTFAGHYEDVVGTHCIFEETMDNNNEKRYQFKATTDKCLKMERTFIRDKTEDDAVKKSDESSSSESSSSDDDDGNDGVNADPMKKITNLTDKQQDTMEVE